MCLSFSDARRLDAHAVGQTISNQVDRAGRTTRTVNRQIDLRPAALDDVDEVRIEPEREIRIRRLNRQAIDELRTSAYAVLQIPSRSR